MSCFNPYPTAANPPFTGIKTASPTGDGYSVTIDWYKSYSPRLDYLVVYNIYYASTPEAVFNEGVKFVMTGNTTTTTIPDLMPGDVYYFAVRGATLPTNSVNLIQFPTYAGMMIYPSSMLSADITDESLSIPVDDVSSFPTFGLIQIGTEIIEYTSVNYGTSSLITTDGRRGMFGTEPRPHTVDGYDGYAYTSGVVSHFAGFEDKNLSIMLAENYFGPYKNAYTADDGYKEKDSIVYTDSSASDCLNENFRKYDYAGYHSTRIDDYLNGKIGGSYFGGEFFCADGYNSVGRRIRGLSAADQQNQTQEMLLESYGRPMVLLRRMTSGKTSMHYNNHRENTAHRGLDTFGTDLVLGYEQFFNSRRSDGRILVRFDPTVEDIERSEMGLENKFKPNAWTLSYPILKDGDVLIAFNRDGTPEFRYEIINVTRNTTFSGNDGRQIFSAVRIRKTDPINQVKVIYDTSLNPLTITTSIGSGTGIPPHIHNVTINEGIVSLAQITQTTSVSQGHNHEVINGVVQESMFHSHLIIL